MPIPRGRTATRVHPNSRAIVLEAEWKVMPERIATELRPLVKLAKDQGWKIDGTNNGRLAWRGPNGEGPVYTGYRCNGRDLQNYRAELVRAGLKLDEVTAKEHTKYAEAMETLDATEAIPLETIRDAMKVIDGAMAHLMVKAELYDESRTNAEEWEDLAKEAEQALEVAQQKLSESTRMIEAIRSCFNLAPWAILPEIAKLLSIDANGPAVRIASHPEGKPA